MLKNQNPIPDNCIGYEYSDQREKGNYENGKRALADLYERHFTQILKKCTDSECYFRNMVNLHYAKIENTIITFVFNDERSLSFPFWQKPTLQEVISKINRGSADKMDITKMVSHIRLQFKKTGISDARIQTGRNTSFYISISAPIQRKDLISPIVLNIFPTARIAKSQSIVLFSI